MNHEQRMWTQQDRRNDVGRYFDRMLGTCEIVYFIVLRREIRIGHTKRPWTLRTFGMDDGVFFMPDDAMYFLPGDTALKSILWETFAEYMVEKGRFLKAPEILEFIENHTEEMTHHVRDYDKYLHIL